MTSDRDEEIGSALDEALARVPRHRPTAAFATRLRARLDAVAAGSALATPVAREAPRPRAWFGPFVSACAAAALVVVAMRFGGRTTPSSSSSGELVEEAVNDHLRVVASSHPIEIESGGIHQVKPWFTGRLDFAPRVTFAGDADFALEGGSVGYVHERKAAVFHFRRRLHAITLLVFPADGLAWPEGEVAHEGRLALAARASRGWNVILWRDGELGYALVSDLNRAELETLATRINGD